MSLQTDVGRANYVELPYRDHVIALQSTLRGRWCAEWDKDGDDTTQYTARYLNPISAIVAAKALIDEVCNGNPAPLHE